MPKPTTKPRLIIHGGAGNITRTNLPPRSYEKYTSKLLSVTRETSRMLAKGAAALDAATHAVKLLEDCPLFNSAKGAVFTRDGAVELEASVMVSKGHHKRGVGVALLRHVRNPVFLAREMLLRGDSDGTGGNDGGEGDPSGGSGGAQGHCMLSGPTVENLAKEWGLEMVDEKYFFTRRRWDEHKRGLGKSDQGWVDEEWEERMKGREVDAEEDARWDGEEYLPQGTVGCVALDQYGTLCVATSTGGLTNKLSGRIGDTPTLGAGFWAEEWVEGRGRICRQPRARAPLEQIWDAVGECLPRLDGYEVPHKEDVDGKQVFGIVRAVAMSATGNGDSFLRTAGARTAAAIARFAPERSLASAVEAIAGPAGELQRSAGERWRKTGEGEGGIIGIELAEGVGRVVFDFNCGGMFRCWVDEEGRERVMVFREEY